jgi:hypothetical protein
MAHAYMMADLTGFIPHGSVADKGKEPTGAYQAADRFPNIVIDDFLPERFAETMLAHFGSSIGGDENQSYDREQERLKTSYHPDTLGDARAPPSTP